MHARTHPVASTPQPRPRRRWLLPALATLATLCLALLLGVEFLAHRALPLLRQHIVQSLSARFHAPVQLDTLSVSLLRGVEVSGTGLRIPFAPGQPGTPVFPLLSVQRFAFHTSLRRLMHGDMEADRVTVEGVALHIPPPGQRRGLLGSWSDDRSPDQHLPSGGAPRIAELHGRNLQLFLASGQPGKAPLLFDIQQLNLRNVGKGTAMPFQADFLQPIPRGHVLVSGVFGPWAGAPPAGQPFDPGKTPLTGLYALDHADLGTFHGVRGTLSSTGRFRGTLGQLAVDGKAAVPDLALDSSAHPVPLRASFHAVVDGTRGDTWLQPVHARLGSSDLTATGSIVRAAGGGHRLQLDLSIPHGRVEDLLRFAVKTSPPLMSGTLSLQARVEIPPGPTRVPLKLAVGGTVHLADVQCSNPRWQARLTDLSARAQGYAGSALLRSESSARSQLAAHFALAHGLLTVTDVRYVLPGLQAALNGVYSLDGTLFAFRGSLRTEATASQMVGGWKGLLLTPVDRFLQHDGAGVALPVEVIGVGGELHVGLAPQGADNTPAGLLHTAHAQDQSRRLLQSARSEAALADEEDRRAARATSLQAAQAAHNAAVLHRAEARQEAEAARRANLPPGP